MCGIIGVTGEPDALGVLLDGLHRLEYRGYDSAGVALVADGGLWRVRAAEGTRSVDELAELVADAPAATTGIGHTRWATHGGPTPENAHPHLDCTGRVALVHNGILENHDELAAELAAAGHRLASDTDTEVLAHLVEAALAGGASLVDALRSALSRIEGGTYAVAVVDADAPDVVVAARRVSPLVVGLADGVGYVSSDIPALLGRAARFVFLDDGQLAEVGPGSLVVTTLEGAPVTPVERTVTWDLDAAQKEGHEDFMSKEIAEQPRAVANTVLDRRRPDGTLDLDETRISDEALRDVDRVCLVACGSSYHAALVAKYAIEHWTRLPVEVDIASEFRYRDPVIDDRTLGIFVSQSGETVDTIQAMRGAKHQGGRTLVVSNVVDSSLAREADGVLYTRAGPEVCVAATKTYVTQIVALELLALALAERRATLEPATIDRVFSAIEALPEPVGAAVGRADDVDKVAHKVFGTRDFFFLGRHVGYPVALEGALKLKELSYLRAEGYPGGELKHGPIALIEPGTVVVAVATKNPLYDKMLSNVEQVKSRGATIVLVATDGDERAGAIADHVLWVPGVEPLLSPVVDAVPLQYLAYRLAKLHGLDVDRPRNLAKTVTVE